MSRLWPSPIRSWRRVLVVGLATAGLVALAGPVTATAQEPDPCNPWYEGSAPGDHRVAQTFTVPPGEDQVSGALIFNRSSVGTSGDYVIQLLATDGSGTPTNTVLRSAIGTGGLVDTYFDEPLPVAPGEVYALALTRPGSSAFGYYFKFLDCRISGQMFNSDSQNGPWYVEDAAYDLFAFALSGTPPGPGYPGDPTPPESPDDDDGEGSAKCERAKEKVKNAKEKLQQADTPSEKDRAEKKLKKAKKKKKKACG